MTTTEPRTTEVLWLTPESVGQHPGNLRDATRDIPALAASIQEVGVLVPLIVVHVDNYLEAHPEGEDGSGTFPGHVEYIAVDGNRRQLAAATLPPEAGLKRLLPCLLQPDLAAARAATVTMAVTGLVRDGLTATETAGAVQAMLSTGMKQIEVARTAGMTNTEVKHAKAAARLTGDTATAAEKYELTLDQMAALSDFADDPALVEDLLESASIGPGQFANSVKVALRDRRVARAIAKLAKQYTDQGYTIVDEGASVVAWSDTVPTPVRLGGLKATPDADARITDDEHATCPGRAVKISASHWSEELSITHACTDPNGNGHHQAYKPLPGQPDLYSNTGSRPAGPMTDAEKAERKLLIKRNKEMAAAQGLRLEFIRRTWKSAKHRKAIAAWGLERVVTRDRRFSRWADNHISSTFEEIMGLSHGQPFEVPAAALHGALLWAQVCAAYEHEFPKDAWRQGSSDRARYLLHLVDLGYEPCETEQLMIDQDAAGPADDALTPDDLDPEDDDPDGPGEQDGLDGSRVLYDDRPADETADWQDANEEAAADDVFGRVTDVDLPA